MTTFSHRMAFCNILLIKVLSIFSIERSKIIECQRLETIETYEHDKLVNLTNDGEH